MIHYYVWQLTGRFIFVSVFTLLFGFLFPFFFYFLIVSFGTSIERLNDAFGCEVGPNIVPHMTCYLYWNWYLSTLSRRRRRTFHQKWMSTVWCAHNLKYVTLLRTQYLSHSIHLTTSILHLDPLTWLCRRTNIII